MSFYNGSVKDTYNLPKYLICKIKFCKIQFFVLLIFCGHLKLILIIKMIHLMCNFFVEGYVLNNILKDTMKIILFVKKVMIKKNINSRNCLESVQLQN